jgi:hypothetical protein
VKLLMLLAATLGVSACATTKETRPKLILPTEANIKDAELRDWAGRLAGLKRFKVISKDETDVQLLSIHDLQCAAMFQSWAECSFVIDVESNGKVISSGRQFGQYSPKANGQWDSEIIMWHERRRHN